MNTQSQISPRAFSLVETIHGTLRGRIRAKVKGLLRSGELKEYLELKLLNQDGVIRATANPLTGHILVLFGAQWNHQTIRDKLRDLVLEYREYRKKQLPCPSFNNGRGAVLKKAELGGGATPSWHRKQIEQILQELQTCNQSGLSKEVAQDKLREHGLNILAQTPPRSGWSIFIDYFKSVPVALLTVAAGLSIVTGSIADALVIMGVVVINAALGYATESQSEKIIHSLKHLSEPNAFVIRDGKLRQINAQELVQGDILTLKPGSYVSADVRLIESDRLMVDESALTGESLPVTKTAQTLSQEDVPLAERVNMAYMGTFVTGGQGRAVVVGTGNNTEMGKIQTLVGETQVPPTPMEKQLDRVGSQLVSLSSGVCALVFVIGLLRGYGFLEMLKSSISLAVAAVPEGLPTVATTTLALGISNMRKHHVLIRRLDAVEALGAIQVICLDKTGTLTVNQMSVVEVSTEQGAIAIPPSTNLLPLGGILPLQENPSLLKLIEICILCNSSQIKAANHPPNSPLVRGAGGMGAGGDSCLDNGSYVINGSATENALIELALRNGIDVEAVREQNSLIKTNHRSEDHNFMVTIHQQQGGKKLVAVKGNPTEVLEMCQWRLSQGEIIPLTEEERCVIERENERMASKALRVLGVAYKENGNESAEDCTENLIWVGQIGMADPLRNGIKELIGNFHQAGISTVMLTGDQTPTAYAIGKELNLSQDEPLKILDSSYLNKLEPEVVKGLYEQVHIFARISPSHKLEIVQGFQGTGKVVAMTGDGINDAPALKAAEVGVAMGCTGTDVAREVADVVIEDDNLQTMIVAISQGRTIYRNIGKSVHFLLSTNLSEILVMLASTVAGTGQPLNAMQLLWLNLVTDIFPGLALALEPPEPDVLKVPPRHPDEPILKSSDFRRIVWESGMLSVSSLSAYGYGLARYGISPRSSTIAFMSLVIGQLLHSITCRSQKQGIFSPIKLPPNHYLNLALGGSLILQLISAAIPGLRTLLKITPISLLDLTVIAISALLPLLVNETAKQLPPVKKEESPLAPLDKGGRFEEKL